MDVRLQAGAIQEVLLHVQRLPQAQLPGLLHRAFEQSVDHRPHLLGGQPMGHALHLALGRHAHLVQRIDQAEPLIKRIAGQLTTESTIILLQQRPQERAAQGAT
jgi:hypothetical protein